MNLEPVHIVAAVRTPIGAYQGGLSTLSAPKLGSLAIRAALERAKLAPERIGEVFMGNVLSAGIGQAPARQAALGAGLPDTTPCTTVGKVCGSGLQAVVLAARSIQVGANEIAVAGGMESMSRVPYYLDKARTGYRMGHDRLIDGMIHDGLWDPYNDFHMGNAGELCAKEYGLTREAQDAFASESYRRAVQAQTSGAFDKELVVVEIPQKKGPPLLVSRDEEPERGVPSKFPSLKPAFTPDGTITAANASSVNDGAAALVLASERTVRDQKLVSLARIVGDGVSAQAPEWFTTAPARAITNTLNKLQLQTQSIDLWEINEAFACVPMACAKLAGVDLERVNVNGGAVALGHPIGASGARILTTLLWALEARKLKRGLATLCIGGGEAVAVVIERS
ncbi:MAG TPA: acetyl-CoA C-acyltransferase [Polyangiaceae bacterium]|jgi:acetyl-CoA C-acetyltransferase|nr:acetyl-CoA C-acyltransferase [Polyangiaceae bacterium]